MQINITARDFGGTEFLAQPHRLHLGAQKAEGVDQLEFSLPEQWNGCVVTLHIRHADGTLAEPLALDEAGCVGVGRSFTGWASGEWMLAAANGNGYTAYTRPGQYDVHGILPTEGGGEELTPSVYEQFIARVVDSANAAAEAANVPPPAKQTPNRAPARPLLLPSRPPPAPPWPQAMPSRPKPLPTVPPPMPPRRALC